MRHNPGNFVASSCYLYPTFVTKCCGVSRVTCHVAANAHLSRVQDVREGAPELRRGRGAVPAPGPAAVRLPVLELLARRGVQRQAQQPVRVQRPGLQPTVIQDRQVHIAN